MSNLAAKATLIPFGAKTPWGCLKHTKTQSNQLRLAWVLTVGRHGDWQSSTQSGCRVTDRQTLVETDGCDGIQWRYVAVIMRKR